MKKRNGEDFGFFRVQNKAEYGWIVSCSPAVVVLPVFVSLSESDSSEQSINIKIGLIQIFRHPIGKVSWEFAGGSVEEKERPEEAALRELREETGIASKKLKQIGEFYEAPGRMLFLHHVFVAENPGPPNFKNASHRQEEDIQQFRYFSLYRIENMIKTGKIISGPTLAALSILMRSMPAIQDFGCDVGWPREN